MPSNELFREKLNRERKRQEEERQIRLKREQEGFHADYLRFKEEIETRGRPLFNTLLQSKILDLVEGLAKDKKDMKLGLALHFGFRKREPWDCYALSALSSSVQINKDGKFEWEEGKFRMSYDYHHSDAKAQMLNRYRRTLALPEMMELKISLRWDYRMRSVPEGGEVVDCDTITPFEIERRRKDFYITIGKNLLGPQDWNSPEKVENVIIQEFLRAD